MQIASISEISPACSSAMLYEKSPKTIDPTVALNWLIFNVLSRMYIPIKVSSIMKNAVVELQDVAAVSLILPNRLAFAILLCATVGQPDREESSHSVFALIV